MKAKLKTRCAASKEHKRKWDQIEDALSVLRSTTPEELGNIEIFQI